jgi:hypothetical protein
MDATSFSQRGARLWGALLDRLPDVLIGLIAVGVGAVLLYFGSRGLLDTAGPYRAACTKPWVCLLSLVGGTWMLLMSIRLLRGPGPHRHVLLSQPELFVLSTAITVGSMWIVTFAPRQGIAFVATGLAGLGRWWILRRVRNAASTD